MRDIAAKAIGAKFYYQDCNSMASEEKNLVLTSGQPLFEPDNYQMSKAAAIYSGVGDFYTDTGTVDHYVLSAVGFRQTPVSYEEGLKVRFRALNGNTGTSDIDVAGIGVVVIKKEDGVSDLGAGDIPAGQVIEVVYNAATGFFELFSHKYEDQVFFVSYCVPCLLLAAPAGWILLNDGTIGDASSSGTTRANADCEALFKLIWTNISQPSGNTRCIVSGGVIGVSANADWSAHKNLQIPKMLGRALCSAGFGSGLSNRLLAEADIGQENVPLLEDNNGIHKHPEGDRVGVFGANSLNSAVELSTLYPDSFCHNDAQSIKENTKDSGLGNAHKNMQPSSFFNILMKL